jgi:hypothetical protein
MYLATPQKRWYASLCEVNYLEMTLTKSSLITPSQTTRESLMKGEIVHLSCA